MSAQRQDMLDRLDGAWVDVAIIGGGINGAVSSAALSSAGVSTAIIDRGDFSSVTSQASSNLVWGGFKYLQSYEFKLVWKLCESRNRLIDAYPTQIEPIEFLATFDEQSPYPVWLAGLGAYAYWAIGRFATERPKVLRSKTVEKIEPVIDTSAAKGGLIYSDAYLPGNDARFTFDFVKRAIGRGTLAANYTELVEADFVDDEWRLILRDRLDGSQRRFRARSIVNATGPFIDGLNDMLGVSTKHRIAMSKGIHLIVPRIGSGDRVFAFFDEDDRLYYVIPMGDRSVIGTTDTWVDDPTSPVTDDDRNFVLRQINQRLDLDEPLQFDDIIAERVGVRPLVVEQSADETESDWLALSRKHEIEIDRKRRVVSVFGGKLTDCLNVGEEVRDAISRLRIQVDRLDETWFGEPAEADRARFRARVAAQPQVPDHHADVMWQRYGTSANNVVDRVVVDPALAEPVWDDPLYLRAEVAEIGETEMVATATDFLRRRTSLAMTEREPEIQDRMSELESLLGLKG